MKELSIEEKAKRYDEAIKVAKRNYETIVKMDNDCTFAKEGIVNTFHHMFPELKEGDDERIRKEIINHFKEIANRNEQSWITLDIPCILAWLEKQGEQKPAWSEEDEQYIIDTINLLSFGCSSHSVGEVKDFLKDLKDRVQPQPKQEWKPSDEQMNALNDVISSRDIKYDVLSELWKDLEKLKGLSYESKRTREIVS